MKLLLALTVAVAATFSAPAKANYLSDYLWKEAMIRDSIAEYEGACACPYSLDKNGNVCGERSAWSKPGGENPLCYRSEITNWMLQRYINGSWDSLLFRW